MSLLTQEQLDSMRALTSTAYRHLADVWRIDQVSGHRVLLQADVPCSVSPAKQHDRIATDMGPVDARQTYTGTTAIDTDLKETDQLRNVRTEAGDTWLPDARLTVHTVAKWPAVLAFRTYEEA